MNAYKRKPDPLAPRHERKGAQAQLLLTPLANAVPAAKATYLRTDFVFKGDAAIDHAKQQWRGSLYPSSDMERIRSCYIRPYKKNGLKKPNINYFSWAQRRTDVIG